MPGPSAVSSRAASKPNPSIRRKRDHAEFDFIPESSSPTKPTDVVDLNTDGTQNSRKQRRVGPSNSTIPRTLPTEPHEELLAGLKGKYDIITTSVISSSKINKKVTAVLSHLGHVDLFSQDSRPGIMMLHARAADASKMVTVMEIAKRRMGEIGQVWYQYNRVYEVAEEARGSKPYSNSNGAGWSDGTQIVVEDTVLDDDDEDDSFEPVETPLDLAVRDKPVTESKNTYMSIFLSRVPMPELQAKASITLQTNAGQQR
ncbi:hypothetical protein N0V82_002840 [Gnomoniopsis sp. IMI 355080]|nr:hypothetical protein N0V82_002840 [Gnomoniopsis sp. IMI 355080]